MATTNQEILTQFFEDIRAQIISNSDSQKRNASGRAKAELRIETEASSGKLIDGAGYTRWGWEYGRAPGRMPPIEAIKQWVDDKGIIPDKISKSSLAFLIARKIAREGTDLFAQHEPSGVITEAVTQSRIDALKETFADKFSTLVKTEVINAFA